MDHPPLPGLGLHIGLAGLALGMQAVEGLIQPLLAALAGVLSG